MERDSETGLAYHGARYYAPWLGRWTAADPIGLGDGVNRFAYVSGNPVGFVDSTGTMGEGGPWENNVPSFDVEGAVTHVADTAAYRSAYSEAVAAERESQRSEAAKAGRRARVEAEAQPEQGSVQKTKEKASQSVGKEKALLDAAVRVATTTGSVPSQVRLDSEVQFEPALAKRLGREDGGLRIHRAVSDPVPLAEFDNVGKLDFGGESHAHVYAGWRVFFYNNGDGTAQIDVQSAVIRLAKAPTTIGDPKERFESGGLGTRTHLAKKKTEGEVGLHEQGHLEHHARVARLVDQLAAQLYPALSINDTTSEEFLRLRAELGKLAAGIDKAVSAAYHAEVQDPSSEATRMNNLRSLVGSDARMEALVRTAFLNYIRDNSRRLSR